MFYILLPDLASRTRFIAGLKQREVGAVFHYIPLHSSPAGRRYGRSADPLPVTDSISARLVRLPLWIGLEAHMESVLAAADASLSESLTG